MIGERIPEEIKQDILEVLDYIKPRLPICPAKQQTYLFEVYNKYIKPTYLPDLEEGCGGCRSDVFSKIQFIASKWKRQEKNS